MSRMSIVWKNAALAINIYGHVNAPNFVVHKHLDGEEAELQDYRVGHLLEAVLLESLSL